MANTTILELPDESLEPTNVSETEDKSIQAAAPAPEAAADAEETQQEAQPETKEEPLVELDGEKVPLSEVKKWKQDYANDSKWRDKNRRESEQLNRQRKELAALEVLKAQLKPEDLARIIQPQKPRDLDGELKTLYNQRPEQFTPEYAEWEFKVQTLRDEKLRQSILDAQHSESLKREAEAHNQRVQEKAFEKLDKEGYSEDEKVEMAKWIVTNVRDTQGKFPENSFDLAVHALYPEREVRQAKLEATKKVTESIRKAVPASGGSGNNHRTEQLSPEEEEDSRFLAAIKARNGH